jgi:hypothetical protein
LTVETDRIGRLARQLFGEGELTMETSGYWYWVRARGTRVALGFSLPDAEALLRKRLHLQTGD